MSGLAATVISQELVYPECYALAYSCSLVLYCRITLLPRLLVALYYYIRLFPKAAGDTVLQYTTAPTAASGTVLQ